MRTKEANKGMKYCVGCGGTFPIDKFGPVRCKKCDTTAELLKLPLHRRRKKAEDIDIEKFVAAAIKACDDMNEWIEKNINHRVKESGDKHLIFDNKYLLQQGYPKYTFPYDGISLIRDIPLGVLGYDDDIEFPAHCEEHGMFWTTLHRVYSHKTCGCPECHRYGFNPAAPANLYYAKVFHKGNTLYKIGITNLNFKKRYGKKDHTKMQLLKESYFEIGAEAIELETFYKQTYADKLYQGGDVVLKGAPGNTELFTEDIL